MGDWDNHWEKFDVDALVKEIESRRSTSVPSYTRFMEMKFLRTLCVNKPVKRVCDLGSGMGVANIAWTKGASCVLVDNLDSALVCAKRFHSSFGSKITACKGDIFEAIPKFSGNFDVVWNQGVLEHFKFDKQVSLVRNMAVMTKGGGYVVVMVPNKLNLYPLVIKFFNFLKLFGHKGWSYGFEKPLSTGELRKVFSRVPSLRVVKVKGIVPLVIPSPFKNRMLNAFLVSFAKSFEDTKLADWFGREIVICAQKV